MIIVLTRLSSPSGRYLRLVGDGGVEGEVVVLYEKRRVSKGKHSKKGKGEKRLGKW